MFVPAFTPFTFHWYDGAGPPLIGLAVKTTGVPWQTLRELAVTEMPAVSRGSTVTWNKGDSVPLPQLSEPDTVISPDEADGEKETVMEFVFAPPVTLTPAGRFQV